MAPLRRSARFGMAFLPAGYAVGARIEALLERIEVPLIGLRAEPRRIELVLDLHYSFARLNERQKFVTFLVLETLLVERPIEVGQQVFDLAEIVFQLHREMTGSRSPL